MAKPAVKKAKNTTAKAAKKGPVKPTGPTGNAMEVTGFIDMLSNAEKLTSQQQENLKKIIKISEKFHRDAGIPQPPKTEIGPDTIVLESGHQPNFLPHAGVFKKAFLIDYIRRALEAKGKARGEAKGKRAIAVFGFADYNLATASLLYKNKVPALSRTGFQKVGFQPRKEDKWKAFSHVKKPDEKDFLSEIASMKEFYLNSARMAKYPEDKLLEGFGKLEKTMKDAYSRAKNFPDMNAFMIAQICQSIGISVHFFRYTDIQAQRIFIGEWKALISKLPEFNRTYMESLRKDKVDLNYSEASVPFWLTCGCGTITELGLEALKSPASQSFSAKCLSCGKEHRIDPGKDLDKAFPSLSMNAVSRNVIVSAGLGDALYVSGSGGGLQYGKVSDRVSDALRMRKPATLAWKGRDLRFGMLHFIVFRDFVKSLRLDPALFSSPEKLKKAAVAAITSAPKGERKNMERKAASAGTAFSVSASIADFIVSGIPGKEIASSWEKAIGKAQFFTEGAFYISKSDTIHQENGFPGVIDTGKIPGIFSVMSSISVAGESSGTEEE